MQWFRRARPAPVSWLLTKALIQIIIFWSMFLFVIPPGVAHLADRAGLTRYWLVQREVVAATLFCLGGAVGIASAWTIATLGAGTPLPLDGPRALVTRGPYARVRNPMAVAGVLQGIAVSIWHGSPLVAVFFAAGGVVWHVLVRPVEERDLQATFGLAYDEYRRRVPLWLPRARGRDASTKGRG